MRRVTDQLQDKDKDQEQDEQKIERDQDGGQKLDNYRGLTIRNVDDVSSTIGCHSDTTGASSLEDRGCGRDAMCIRSEPDVRRRDHEAGSLTSSTQYSDVDDSLEEYELDSLGNDHGLPVSRQQHFDDNGVALTISNVPTYDDVCIKDSANVSFGERAFYNGPVTVEKIVRPHPNSTEGSHSGDVNRTNQTPKKRSANPDYGTRGQTVDTENGQDRDKVTKLCSWTLTSTCGALMCVLGLCLAAAVVLCVVLVLDDHPSFVEREAWGAKPPKEPLSEMKLPVPYVFISHTAQEPCETQSDCIARVQWVQSFHAQSRNWSDIGYSFLVGGDGYVYVGRGWDYNGAHTYGYNNRSIGISFIGTFNTIVPPNRQLRAAQQLMKLGVEKGKIVSNFTLLGHRQVSSTLSPGDALYNIIETWPNWSPTP